PPAPSGHGSVGGARVRDGRAAGDAVARGARRAGPALGRHRADGHRGRHGAAAARGAPAGRGRGLRHRAPAAPLRQRGGAPPAARAALPVLAALRAEVYGGSATALLPPLHIGAAGPPPRLEGRGRLARGGVLVGGAVLLVVSMLPGTVSHLTDGTRYDYRSAF